MDVFDRIMDLGGRGYFCAQILMQMALDIDGASDPALVRSASALNGGVGYSGGICGALTGGCCFISYFAGKGEDDEVEHSDQKAMHGELIEWFRGYAAEHGGIDCLTLLGGDERNKIQRCPIFVRDVFDRCMDILEGHGVL